MMYGKQRETHIEIASHSRHACPVTQQTCLLSRTADMSAASHSRNASRVKQQTCLLCGPGHGFSKFAVQLCGGGLLFLTNEKVPCIYMSTVQVRALKNLLARFGASPCNVASVQVRATPCKRGSTSSPCNAVQGSLQTVLVPKNPCRPRVRAAMSAKLTPSLQRNIVGLFGVLAWLMCGDIGNKVVFFGLVPVQFRARRAPHSVHASPCNWALMHLTSVQVREM